MRIASKAPSRIGAKEFSRFLGIKPSQLPAECKRLLADADLRYRRLTPAERDRLVLRIINRINSPELTKAGKAGKARWQRGWDENYRNFVTSNYNIDELVPKYIHPQQEIRLDGDYAKPLGPNFELEYYNVFRRWLYDTYLKKESRIYEFGCGTGYNLIELAQRYPDKELHGLDWVSGPKNILAAARKHYSYNVTGHIFDMFHPDPRLRIPRGSAMLAVGALEQLGTGFEPFLRFILKASPSIFVHVDSLIELHDQSNLFDSLPVLFDRKRNYLDGYLTRLRQLEKKGKIKILATRRSRFGSLYHDGYSLIVWRPV